MQSVALKTPKSQLHKSGMEKIGSTAGKARRHGRYSAQPGGNEPTQRCGCLKGKCPFRMSIKVKKARQWKDSIKLIRAKTSMHLEEDNWEWGGGLSQSLTHIESLK